MRLFRNLVIPLLAGFVVAFMFHGLVTCESYDLGSDLEGEVVLNVETKAMRKGAAAAEDAFKSGKISKVLEILSDEAQSLYGDLLNEADQSHLEALGSAFENRKLSVSSEIFAEYAFSEGGKQFSITLARQSDESWKVTRL